MVAAPEHDSVAADWSTADAYTAPDSSSIAVVWPEGYEVPRYSNVVFDWRGVEAYEAPANDALAVDWVGATTVSIAAYADVSLTVGTTHPASVQVPAQAATAVVAAQTLAAITSSSTEAIAAPAGSLVLSGQLDINAAASTNIHVVDPTRRVSVAARSSVAVGATTTLPAAAAATVAASVAARARPGPVSVAMAGLAAVSARATRQFWASLDVSVDASTSAVVSLIRRQYRRPPDSRIAVVTAEPRLGTVHAEPRVAAIPAEPRVRKR